MRFGTAPCDGYPSRRVGSDAGGSAAGDPRSVRLGAGERGGGRGSLSGRRGPAMAPTLLLGVVVGLTGRVVAHLPRCVGPSGLRIGKQTDYACLWGFKKNVAECGGALGV